MPPKKQQQPFVPKNTSGKPLTGKALADFNSRQEKTKQVLAKAIDKQNEDKKPAKPVRRPDVRVKPATGATRSGSGSKQPDIRNGKPVGKNAPKPAAKPAPKAPAKPAPKKPASKKNIVV